MQRRWLGSSGAILLLLGTALLAGCKQKQGEQCQLNSDCSDNFVCCIAKDPAARTGVCVTPETCVSVVDAALTDRSPAGEKVPPKVDKAAAEKGAPDKSATPDKTPVDQAPLGPDIKPDTKK